MNNYLSTLRLCNIETFHKTVSPFRQNEIAFPKWFVENIKQGHGVFSKGAYDCTIPTFANAGVNGTQQHLCPNDETLSKLALGNSLLLNKIKPFIENVNGLLIGGIKGKNSETVQHSIEDFCIGNKIPYSKLLKQKNTIDNAGTHVAYKAFSDEYLVSSKEISKFLEENKIKLLKMDEIEKRAFVEEFLHNHFNEVNVEILDLIV